jgi:hypothetical protein
MRRKSGAASVRRSSKTPWPTFSSLSWTSFQLPPGRSTGIRFCACLAPIIDPHLKIHEGPGARTGVAVRRSPYERATSLGAIVGAARFTGPRTQQLSGK